MAVNLELGANSAAVSAPRELFPVAAADNQFSPYEPAPDGQRLLVRATLQQQAAGC